MSMATVQDDSIIWGDLQLHGPLPVDATYEIDTMADDTNFGNPVSIIEQVQSMAIDGALAARTGWEARTIPVRLRLAANDGETLAQVEQALTAQVLLDRPPPIEWTPPLGSSAPAVFDVLVADLQRDTSAGWDTSEKYYGYRYFALTLTCLPFARAMDTVDVPAIAPPPDPGAPATVTVVDDCTSLAHWAIATSGTNDSIYMAGSSEFTVQADLYHGTGYLRAVRTLATTQPAGQPYLFVDVNVNEALRSGPSINVPGSYRVMVDGIAYSATLVLPGAGENPIVGSSGSTRVYFQLPTTSFTTLQVYKDYDDSWNNASGATLMLTVYRVGFTDTLGDTTTSTTREQSRLTTITGAMPTRATIRLADATPAALGTSILVCTSSNTNWAPPLRKWLTSGGAIADTARVSGGRNPMGSDIEFLFPANLLDAGAYALLGYLKCTAAGTLSWSAKMTDSTGANTIGSAQVQSGSVTIPVTTGMTPDGYKLFDLADHLQLPPFEVETSDYYVLLTLTGTSNMTLDEALLCCLDTSAITWLEDSDGLNWLEIRSPDLGAARPSVFGGIGDVGALSACIDYKCKAFGAHRFEPGPLSVFTFASESLVAQCELEYFPRFHSHPAADQSDPDTSGD